MGNKKDLRVCVIIPAYNEGGVIHGVIASAAKTFKKSAYRVDIVTVDDGSVDTTSSEARRADSIVIRHILNSGAGGATATGLSYASQAGYDIAATMDADGQHLAEDVLRGIEIVAKTDADLLIGSRLAGRKDMPQLKVLGNKGLSIITYLLFGVSSTDSQSGLRVFSRRALEQLRWKTSGYEFCSEMLWRAKQIKLNVDEYPITAIYTEYSKAKGQNNWNGVNIVKSLLKRRIAEFFG